MNRTEEANESMVSEPRVYEGRGAGTAAATARLAGSLSLTVAISSSLKPRQCLIFGERALVVQSLICRDLFVINGR